MQEGGMLNVELWIMNEKWKMKNWGKNEPLVLLLAPARRSVLEHKTIHSAQAPAGRTVLEHKTIDSIQAPEGRTVFMYQPSNHFSTAMNAKGSKPLRVLNRTAQLFPLAPQLHNKKTATHMFVFRYYI